MQVKSPILKVATTAILLLGMTAAPSFAESPDFPHLQTTGYGEVIAKPDQATFTVEVIATNKTAKGSKKTVDKAITAFTQRLLEAGLAREDIQSANIVLGPQYNYKGKNNQPILTGYRATRRMTVKVDDLDKLNTYLDSALGEGINAIHNIELQVKDQQSLKEAARQAAITDANAKARSLVAGFDMQVASVWQIRYQSNSPSPIIMRTMAMEASSKQDKTYADMEIVIRDSVDVTYKLR